MEDVGKTGGETQHQEAGEKTDLSDEDGLDVHGEWLRNIWQQLDKDLQRPRKSWKNSTEDLDVIGVRLKGNRREESGKNSFSV